jgi:beta-lactamase regulating signal transducer with metallopeptidase domain
VEENGMHEHIQRALYYFEIHLLFASIVWCAAWMLTSIGRGSATTKYWIWVATLLNFILPLGAMFDKLLAAHLSWATPIGLIGGVGVGIAQNAPAAALWLLGATLMITRLCLRMRADRRDVRTVGQRSSDSRPSFRVQGITVSFTGPRQAPAVAGVWRPRILLPDGIDRLLSRRELDAVLIHELTHARRRDNLIRLVHEVVLCLLWFHPLVWLTGARLALFRELSCDESVIERARGRDLIAALAKLANPEPALLLQAMASSFLGLRLARLSARPRGQRGAANALLAMVFGAVCIAGILGTVAHTACCFVAKI